MPVRIWPVGPGGFFISKNFAEISPAKISKFHKIVKNEVGRPGKQIFSFFSYCRAVPQYWFDFQSDHCHNARVIFIILAAL